MANEKDVGAVDPEKTQAELDLEKLKIENARMDEECTILSKMVAFASRKLDVAQAQTAEVCERCPKIATDQCDGTCPLFVVSAILLDIK